MVKSNTPFPTPRSSPPANKNTWIHAPTQLRSLRSGLLYFKNHIHFSFLVGCCIYFCQIMGTILFKLCCISQQSKIVYRHPLLRCHAHFICWYAYLSCIPHRKKLTVYLPYLPMWLHILHVLLHTNIPKAEPSQPTLMLETNICLGYTGGQQHWKSLSALLKLNRIQSVLLLGVDGSASK